ncbi:MAG: hypothetical protein ABEI06_03690 [Halobacteriaceae archaeon]
MVAAPVVNALLMVGAISIIIAIHTLITIVGFRFLRLQLSTSWAPILYGLVLLPIIFIGTTIVLSISLAVWIDLQLSRELLIALFWVIPLGLGITIERLWMKDPEEVEVPAKASESTLEE